MQRIDLRWFKRMLLYLVDYKGINNVKQCFLNHSAVQLCPAAMLGW